MKKVLLFLITLLFCLPYKSQAQVYVDIDATGSNNGTSWTDAYTNLQNAIDATTSGEIWIAEGTYVPSKDAAGNASPANVRTKTFKLKNNIQLYGGFVGTETLKSQRDWLTHFTILSGLLPTAVKSYHVVSILGTVSVPITNTLIVDGLIIENGHADGTGTNANGGGMYMTYSSAIFQNTIFRNHLSTGHGSAAYMSYGSSQFLNCTVHTNSGPTVGGSPSDGGGLNFNNGVNIKIINCLFYSNASPRYGGAIYLNSTTSQITNCTFSKNNGSNGGRVIATTQTSTDPITNITNCIFKDNIGGFYDVQGFQGNLAGVTIRNSFITGLQPGLTYISNYATNPMLVSTSTNNYNLSCGSPAINVANTSAGITILTTDILNRPRIVSLLDIGAFEFQSSFTVSSSNDSLCGGQSVILSAIGGTNMSWNNGAINNVPIIPTTTTSYTATGTDANGCTFTLTLPIHVTPRPDVTITASKDTICAGSNIVLNASGATTYNWSNGVVNGVAFAPVATNTYTVIGTSTMCSDTTQIGILVIDIADDAISANSTTLCSGDSTTVNIANSTVGAEYFLRNATGTILDGPVAGTGSALTFNTGALTMDTTLNVFADVPSLAYNNYALDFDGTNDYVATTATLSAINTFTIEAWLYPRATVYKRIVSNFDGVSTLVAGEFILDTYNATNNGRGLRFNAANASNVTSSYSVPNVLTLNTWNHVAMTFNSGVVTFYVDGIQVGTNTFSFTSIPTNTYQIYLGEDRTAAAGTEYFNGQMDELRIWNVAKTMAQIVANKDNCLTGFETGLRAYFPFDDGSGNILTNLANGNNGTLTNMNTSSDWVTGTNLSLCTSGNCDLQMSQTVTINVNPTYNQTESASVCNGGSYTFPDGTTQNNITTQVVYASNFQTVGSGCDSIVTTTVTAQSSISSSQTLTLCAGESITIGTNTYNATGNYTDTFTAANSCDSTVTTNLTVNAPIDITLVLAGTTLTANQSGATYQWLDCNNNNAPISGETNISFTPTANGNYAVEITFNNCTDTSACQNVTGVGINAIPNIVTNIYPNPAKDVLNIVTTEIIEQVSIYNVNGALVRTLTNNLQTIPVANLPQGMYILVLQSQNGVTQHRFVKE